MQKKINFFEPYINEFVLDTLSSAVLKKDIGYTETVFKFEDELKKFGLTSPVCLNSNSSGLVVALKALGVGDGDEVIIPRQTFIATGLAVLEVGAVPVFCDINIDTGSLDLKSAEKLITSKTRSIIFVHWGGNGHYADDFLKLARKHRIGLIEDAAHAFGANINNYDKLGKIKFKKHFIVFSFQAIKFFTTGDGGCICSHPSYHDYIKSLSWFGINKNRSKGRRSLTEEKGLDVRVNGYKYNMNSIQASIGLGNLKNIEQRIQNRRNRAKSFYNAFFTNKTVKPIIKNEKQLKLGIFWFFPLICDNRHDFINYLNKNNVPSSTIDYRIDVNPIFNKAKKDSGNQQHIFDNKFLALPLNDHIPEKEIDRFCDVFKKY